MLRAGESGAVLPGGGQSAGSGGGLGRDRRHYGPYLLLLSAEELAGITLTSEWGWDGLGWGKCRGGTGPVDGLSLIPI